MVSIFPNPCLCRRSLRSNLGGIDLEKLYRATLRARDKTTLLDKQHTCIKEPCEARGGGGRGEPVKKWIMNKPYHAYLFF